MHGGKGPRALTGLAVAALLALAGCGGSSGSGAAVKADASASTTASGSTGTKSVGTVGPTNAKAALLAVAADKAAATTVSMELSMGGTTLMTGAVDPAAKRSHIRLDLGALFSAVLGGVSGSTGASGGNPFGGLGGSMEVLTDGTTAYLNLGSLGGLLGVPGDTPWVKLDDPGKARSLAGSVGDPTQIVAQLKALTGEVTEKGTETVRGVATTRYGATIRYADVLRDLSAQQRAELDAALAQAKLDPAALVVPVDVWVDAEGLPRRITTDLSTVLAGAGAAGGDPAVGELLKAFGTTTVELFDFGKPVSITLPPAGQVVDARRVPGLGAALGG